ncbi:hypothetical protein Lser_V15G00409 [Lactuca serriola]
MATYPFVIFSKTPNFFNCKSIANPNRRPVLRAHSPSGRFYTSSLSNSCASSTSAFSSSPSSFFQNRSASPTRVNVYGSSPSASNIRFSLDNRQISPSRSISVIPRSNNSNQASKKQLDKARRMCMCSPTSHPGLFGAMLLAFFFTSSKLTKMGEDRKRTLDADFKEGGQRKYCKYGFKYISFLDDWEVNPKVK